MNKLNKLYKAILESLGCVVKDDYTISMVNKSEEYPVKVDGKQVYLPVSSVLDLPAIGKAFFHPGCESITSKETEMDKVLRTLITSTIYFTIRPVTDVLFRVAQKKSSKTLPAITMESLEPIAKATKDNIAEVVDLIKRITFKPEYEGFDTRVVALTITRGGKTENDEHVYYRCTPSFPYYKELTRIINQNSRLADEPKTQVIFGEHKYSYQSLLILQRIFEIAIPCVLNPARAESVSTTQTAARMCAMLRCFGYIVNEINTIVGKFRKEFDSVGMYGIDISWIEDLDNLPEIVSLVPPMQYNNYNTPPRAQQQSTIGADPFSVNSNTTQQPAPPANDAPTPSPIVRQGETYIGMNVLPNGLHEFRYQHGQIVRIECVDELGRRFDEYINIAVTQPAYQQPVNTYAVQQPVYQQPMYDNWTNQGWVNGGFIQQPNGVVVPIFPQDYGNQMYYQQPQQTGWGNSAQYSNNQPASSLQGHNGFF